MSPIRVHRSALVPGSGGAGEFRGGLAMERDYEILAGVCTVSGYLQQAAPETAPWGYAGGGPGGLAGCWLPPARPGRPRRLLAPAGRGRRTGAAQQAYRAPPQARRRLRYRSAGGGGWGDPGSDRPRRWRKIARPAIWRNSARRQAGTAATGRTGAP